MSYPQYSEMEEINHSDIQLDEDLYRAQKKGSLRQLELEEEDRKEKEKIKATKTMRNYMLGFLLGAVIIIILFFFIMWLIVMFDTSFEPY